MSFRTLLQSLVEADSARNALLDAWRRIPLSSYVWEMPALTQASLVAPFESVAVSAPALALRSANPTAFRDHLAGMAAVAFPSFGGDAWLVSPGYGSPEEDNASGHLAAFARGASQCRGHHLLSLLGATALQDVDEQPRWVSTNGLGVPWLHFRIDQRPKYYQHAPYRRPGYLH